MLPKVLSFSGRKHSGKTELANVSREFGYQVINFADAMKELVCACLGISREYLEENKDKMIPGRYNLRPKVEYISREIGIKEEIVSEHLQKPFDSIRQILQIIGTNLIREHDNNWHVNKIRKKIMENPHKYYCLGDTRFPNEKKMVLEFGGECWFIVRPGTINIYEHISETSLTHQDFTNVIVNNKSKEHLINKWKGYLVSKHTT